MKNIVNNQVLLDKQLEYALKSIETTPIENMGETTIWKINQMKHRLDEVIQSSVEKKMQANNENCFDSEEDKDIEVDDFLCEDSELPKKEYSKINAQVRLQSNWTSNNIGTYKAR